MKNICLLAFIVSAFLVGCNPDKSDATQTMAPNGGVPRDAPKTAANNPNIPEEAKKAIPGQGK
jgi:hypothetical protein